MSAIQVLNLLEVAGNQELEPLAAALIREFSCPRNAEVESFLKLRALDFTRKKSSVSYLVLDGENRLLGYFTLAHKNLCIKAECLSKNRQRRLRNCCGNDDGNGVFNVSAFLIAQLGKNFALSPQEGIAGDALLRLAMRKLCEAQLLVGGGVVFLECEDREKLLAFYRREPNCFEPIGERVAQDDCTKYLQLMRFL